MTSTDTSASSFQLPGRARLKKPLLIWKVLRPDSRHLRPSVAQYDNSAKTFEARTDYEHTSSNSDFGFESRNQALDCEADQFRTDASHITSTKSIVFEYLWTRDPSSSIVLSVQSFIGRVRTGHTCSVFTRFFLPEHVGRCDHS